MEENKAKMILKGMSKLIEIPAEMEGQIIQGINEGLKKVEPIIIKEHKRKRTAELHEKMAALNNLLKAANKLDLDITVYVAGSEAYEAEMAWRSENYIWNPATGRYLGQDVLHESSSTSAAPQDVPRQGS